MNPTGASPLRRGRNNRRGLRLRQGLIVHQPHMSPYGVAATKIECLKLENSRSYLNVSCGCLAEFKDFTPQLHKFMLTRNENRWWDCVWLWFSCCVRISLPENFSAQHSGLDPESRLPFWIPAFAGMTNRRHENFMQRLGKPCFSFLKSDFTSTFWRIYFTDRPRDSGPSFALKVYSPGA